MSAFDPLRTLALDVMSSAMVALRTSIAAVLVANCTGAVAAVPLDDFISFDDPYHCSASKDFDALLNGFIRWDEVTDPGGTNHAYRGTLASPPVPAKFRHELGKPQLAIEGDEYRVNVPLRGTWQGLPLQSLVVVQWVESETGFYLVFDATPEQVRAAANKAGFRVPASGSEYRDQGVMGVNVGVETYAGKGALYCIDG